MNCQEFENRIDTLARGVLTDARALTDAAAHEESCGVCAARLADERALSTGLRALASEMKSVEAPARTEAALLTAFRTRSASEEREDLNETAKVAANVIPLTARVPAQRLSWVKTVAVASLAAAASLALFVLIRPGAGTNAPRAGANSGVDQKAMIEPPPGAVNAKTTSEVAQAEPPAVEDDGATAPAATADRPLRASFTPRARAVNADYVTGGGRAVAAQPAANTSAQEIATDFIPLTQGAQYAQAEEGHLVRVELPRTALASFGLPLNAETAGGRVKADVLLGEDGVARAIRFIR